MPRRGTLYSSPGRSCWFADPGCGNSIHSAQNLLYLNCPISTLPRWFTTFRIFLPTLTATEPWRPGTNWSAIMVPAYPAANNTKYSMAIYCEDTGCAYISSACWLPAGFQLRRLKLHLSTRRRDCHPHPTRASADGLRRKPIRRAAGRWLSVYGCYLSGPVLLPTSWLHSSRWVLESSCLNTTRWLVSTNFDTVRREFPHGDS